MKKILRVVKTAVLVPIATVISLVVLFFLTLAGCPGGAPPVSICDPVHQPEKRPEEPRPATPEAKAKPQRPPGVICDPVHEPPPNRVPPPLPH